MKVEAKKIRVVYRSFIGKAIGWFCFLGDFWPFLAFLKGPSLGLTKWAFLEPC